MKYKLWYLTKNSLKKKMKTKWFVIANLIILIVIIGLLNIDSIIKYFGGDFNNKTEIIVIDNASLYDKFYNNYVSGSNYINNSSYEIINYDKSYEEAIEEVKKDKILLELNSDIDNFISVKMTTNKNIDTSVYQLITSSLNAVKREVALSHYNISQEILDIVDAPLEIERERLDDSKSMDEMMNLIMGTVFPLIILPFFMLAMFLVQMIGAEINEEKTTKGMEIIISNVSPSIHFASKVLAGNIFVLSQGLLLVIYALLGMGIRITTTGNIIGGETEGYISSLINSLNSTGLLSSLSSAIPVTLILMLITFFAYSLLAGVLASMTTNMEDYQQLQTPIMIISVAAYYLSFMAATFEGSIAIKILGFVPFISALLAPALLVLGQFTILDICIAIVIMLIFIYFLYKYGMKIYKVGILNYSGTGLWKKMFKAVKK